MRVDDQRGEALNEIPAEGFKSETELNRRLLTTYGKFLLVVLAIWLLSVIGLAVILP